MPEPTYRSLARRAYAVARSHVTHVLPRLRAFAWECGFVAAVVFVTMPVGIHIGATRAEERHAESLRRIIPVAEAALVAHERAIEVTKDTLEMLEVDDGH